MITSGIYIYIKIYIVFGVLRKYRVLTYANLMPPCFVGIKPTHAGYSHVTFDPPAKKPERFELGLPVKNRNEPMHIQQVLQVLAGVRGEPAGVLADAIYRNTLAMFFPKV